MAVTEIPRDQLHGEIVFPREIIIERARKLAFNIFAAYEKHESSLLVVPLLDGAEPFAKLMEEEMGAIGFRPEFFPVKVTTYDINNNPIDPKLETPLPGNIFRPGRHYLVADDMVHRGITMAFMNERLTSDRLIKSRRGDTLKRLANLAMIERQGQLERDVFVDYAAFKTKLSDWLVGFGLDDQRLEGLSPDCGRYLPYVAKALPMEGITYLRNEHNLPDNA